MIYFHIKLNQYSIILKLVFFLKNNMVELSFALMLIEPDSLNEKFNNRGSSLKISIKKLNYLYDGISKIC